MKESKRHGQVVDILQRSVINQGDSKMITLTKYLGDKQNVIVYILKANERHVLIEIDINPEGV